MLEHSRWHFLHLICVCLACAQVSLRPSGFNPLARIGVEWFDSVQKDALLQYPHFTTQPAYTDLLTTAFKSSPPFEQRNEQGKQKFAVDIIAAALGAAEHYKLVEEPVRSATKALIGQLELMAAEDAPPPATAPEPEEGCCCVVS